MEKYAAFSLCCVVCLLLYDQIHSVRYHSLKGGLSKVQRVQSYSMEMAANWYFIYLYAGIQQGWWI